MYLVDSVESLPPPAWTCPDYPCHVLQRPWPYAPAQGRQQNPNPGRTHPGGLQPARLDNLVGIITVPWKPSAYAPP